MFSLLKLLIWVAGIAALSYLGLRYYGYDINLDYFTDQKKECKEKLKECSSQVVHQGIDNAKCDVDCADPKLIIKKQ